MTGVLGLVLGVWGGGFAGMEVDQRYHHPWGSSSDGILIIGHLVWAAAGVGALLGTVLGALGGHRVRGGKGPFWRTLGVTLVGLAAVAVLFVLFVWTTPLVFLALPVLPVAAAVSLELGHTSRE